MCAHKVKKVGWNWAMVHKDIILDDTLDDSDLRLYAYLQWRGGDDDETNVGLERMSRELHRSRTSIWRSMKSLIAHNLIRRERQPYHSSITYVFDAPTNCLEYDQGKSAIVSNVKQGIVSNVRPHVESLIVESQDMRVEKPVVQPSPEEYFDYLESQKPKPVKIPHDAEEVKARIRQSLAKFEEQTLALSSANYGSIFELPESLQNNARTFADLWGRGPHPREKAQWIKILRVWEELGVREEDIKTAFTYMRECKLTISGPQSLTNIITAQKQESFMQQASSGGTPNAQARMFIRQSDGEFVPFNLSADQAERYGGRDVYVVESGQVFFNIEDAQSA